MKKKTLWFTAALAISSVILFFQIQSSLPAFTSPDLAASRDRQAEPALQNKFKSTQAVKAEQVHVAVIRGSDQLASATGGEEFIQTSINASAFTSLQTDFSIANTHNGQFPSLEEFAADVRAHGMGGLWADGLFAYRFYAAEWGVVPDTSNTASYSILDGYHGFFIHNYLGGSRLYAVSGGIRVAVIGTEGIDWYEINGIHRFAGTSTGNGCEYIAPFYDWNGGNSYSALDLIKTYYTSPFAIQTCICTGNKNGMLILTGSPIY